MSKILLLNQGKKKKKNKRWKNSFYMITFEFEKIFKKYIKKNTQFKKNKLNN